MEAKKELGKRIRFIREELGMTQTAFAKGLGISASFQSDVERSLKIPSFDLVLRIVDKYNVSPQYILMGKDAPFTGEEELTPANGPERPFIPIPAVKTEDDALINKIFLFMINCPRVRYALFEFFLGYEQKNKEMMDAEFKRIMEQEPTAQD